MAKVGAGDKEDSGPSTKRVVRPPLIKANANPIQVTKPDRTFDPFHFTRNRGTKIATVEYNPMNNSMMPITMFTTSLRLSLSSHQSEHSTCSSSNLKTDRRNATKHFISSCRVHPSPAYGFSEIFRLISTLSRSSTDALSVFSRICVITCLGDSSPQLAPCWK